MTDTQETNLPIEEGISIEEKGELETSQSPAVNTAETAYETEVISDDTVSESEEIPDENEDIVLESEVEPEKAVPETQIESEETVLETETEIEPEETVLETEPEIEPEETVLETEPESEPEPETEPEETVLETETETEPEETVLETKTEAEPETETEPEEAVLETETETEPEETVLETEPEEIEEIEEPEEVEEDEEPVEVGEVVPNDMSITKNDIIKRLLLINEEPKRHSRNEVDTLKQTYYKIRRAEVEAIKSEFLEGGGDEKDFIVPEDETEAQLKSLIAENKAKRNTMTADEERQKETNLIIKQHLIERMKILTESQDDFNKRYREFREIQRKWKEIKPIPQEYSRELWRNYQLYNERFYDIVKINNQFRDYDFKKNLEMKTVICETVERLAEEKDATSAFQQLQKIHQQWREIGPVSKDHRISIWERFKAASAVITKKQQDYYEGLKGQEEENLERKQAICKELEDIDISALATLRDWERKTEKVMALQKKWRSIGAANRRQNSKIFERFRVASDNYFNKKTEFYKTIRKETDKNLELKKALVEKAEALKTSEDWKETAKAFMELQSEWKKIGPVGRKYSEAIWKQFIAACDFFFERKNKESNSQKSEEQENLEAKKALVEKIKTIDRRLTDDEALTLLRGYVTEWNTIGYVPFKEKDRLHKSFREVIDKQFDRLKVNERDRRGQQYRSNQAELPADKKNKLYNERDKLMRTFDRMKNELQTYENNIGFISSKGGNGLLKEIDRKIERLKEDMEIIVKKIEAIDENLD